jgi:hypothetical protein
MKRTIAIMVGLLVLGFAFAAAQQTTRTEAQEKAQIQTEVKAQTRVQAKTQTKPEFRYRNRIAFIDEDGDGINDRANDADGDGVPNCQDPDWVQPADGTGYQYRKGALNDPASGEARSGYAYQLARDDDGDGIPNGQDPDWVRPEDGSGYQAQHKIGQPNEAEMTKGLKAGKITTASFGKGSFRSGGAGAARMAGAGVCDGTGPKGNVQRKGRH